MNVEAQLLPLALQAIEDEDAVPVLADYIIETGWWDDRLSEPRNEQGHYYRLKMRGEPDIPPQDREEFLGAVAQGACSLRSRCKPIVAVLMFGRWPLTPWELTDTCLYIEAYGVRHPAYRSNPCGSHTPMGFTCQCWDCVTSQREAQGRFPQETPGFCVGPTIPSGLEQARTSPRSVTIPLPTIPTDTPSSRR